MTEEIGGKTKPLYQINIVSRIDWNKMHEKLSDEEHKNYSLGVLDYLGNFIVYSDNTLLKAEKIPFIQSIFYRIYHQYIKKDSKLETKLAFFYASEDNIEAVKKKGKAHVNTIPDGKIVYYDANRIYDG
jgi:hypothetical protein